MTLDQIKQADEINKKLHELFSEKLKKESNVSCYVQSWEIESENEDSITFSVDYVWYGPYQSGESDTQKITISKEELSHG